jgi:DNA-binding transcriptional MocR family regulator
MLAPGLRLGWISAVRPIVEQLALLKQRIDPSTQNLSQLVVSELLETGVFDRHLAALRGEHRRRRDAMVRALRQAVPAGKLRFSVPEGGLFLWCQLQAHVRADLVRQHALADSVVVVTGEPFYVDRGGTRELRLCYSGQPPERFAGAAHCLARSIAQAERQASVGPAYVPIA